MSFYNNEARFVVLYPDYSTGKTPIVHEHAVLIYKLTFPTKGDTYVLPLDNSWSWAQSSREEIFGYIHRLVRTSFQGENQ